MSEMMIGATSGIYISYF